MDNILNQRTIIRYSEAFKIKEVEENKKKEIKCKDFSQFQGTGRS